MIEETDIENLRVPLLQLGESHDGLYPWHHAQDPFHILIAEYFLRRTTRTVVARVFPRVVQKYPTASALANAEPEELYEIAREAGLKQRTLRLISVAQALVDKGELSPDRQSLLELPSVGPYIADAVLLYGFKVPAFALDSSVQRVLWRVLMQVDPKKNSDPYKDKALLKISGGLTSGLESPELRLLHQGILYVAWAFCRPLPLCPKCPLKEICSYPEMKQQTERAYLVSKKYPKDQEVL